MRTFEEFDGGSTYKPVFKSTEDEYSLAKVQLESMIENINNILSCLPDGDLPAWVQDKISVSNHSMEAISDWCKTNEVDELVEEKKSEKSKKGKSVPGKYLTKNKSAMKKEIDTYAGKDEYKTKWDADYKSGKGGSGKRYKTKKSAATKAYQKKYGK